MHFGGAMFFTGPTSSTRLSLPAPIKGLAKAFAVPDTDIVKPGDRVCKGLAAAPVARTRCLPRLIDRVLVRISERYHG